MLVSDTKGIRMKVSSNIFWVLAIFFVIAATAYTVWNLVSVGAVEWNGTLTIGLTGVLSIFLGFFLARSHAGQATELPEDRTDADIDDGDPEIGFFEPYSWWPILLAAGCSLIFFALAVGLWMLFIAVPLTFVALIGWVYEGDRGRHSH